MSGSKQVVPSQDRLDARKEKFAPCCRWNRYANPWPDGIFCSKQSRSSVHWSPQGSGRLARRRPLAQDFRLARGDRDRQMFECLGCAPVRWAWFQTFEIPGTCCGLCMGPHFLQAAKRSRWMRKCHASRVILFATSEKKCIVTFRNVRNGKHFQDACC